MMLHFIYALIVTPFEQDLLKSKGGNWEYINMQDFPIRALYCANSQEFIFFGDNIKTDILHDINQFLIGLNKAGISYQIDKRIINLAKGEDEMCKKTVAQYL